MAVEQKRGCGYRKVGGLYLRSDGIGVPCDRLPFELTICGCCGQGVKQALGWTWIDVAKFFEGKHVEAGESFDSLVDCECRNGACPLCSNPEAMGKAGLLWIGKKFYKRPSDFVSEGVEMGFSRRIKAVPHGFKLGETWILLAHPEAISRTEVITDEKGSNAVEVFKPAIFFAWKPERIEKICVESDRSNTEEMEKLEKRGITPVFVPDDDPDHQGNVHDDFEREKKGEK